MKLSGWLGRYQFVLGRVFEPGPYRGFSGSSLPGSSRLFTFSLGRWGLLVIRWAPRRSTL
jgi:hypothetical protein